MRILRAGHVLRGLVMASAVLACAAQAQDIDKAVLADWIPAAQRYFAAPAPGALPAELQQAAVQMSERAQARLVAEAPRWVAELRARHGPDTTPGQLQIYLFQRLYGEIVRWYLQPLAEPVAQAWIDAAIQPGFCTAPNGASWLSARTQRWALVAPAAREALLKSEAEAMERLGLQATVPERPVPGAIEAALEAVSGVRRGVAQPKVPMPPIVAREVLSDQRDMITVPAEVRCALNQWWLREQLAAAGTDGAARAAALRAFLVDWAPDIDDFAGRRTDLARTYTDAPGDTYPRLARRHELTGTVLVRASLNAAGRVERARVVGRKLQVPGVVGRPLAFETLLDEDALRRARGHQATPSADGKPFVRTYEFAFKLE